MKREAAHSRGFSAFHSLMATRNVLHDRLERRLQESMQGASLAWMEVLALLQDRPDGTARMQELADHIVLSKSGMTRLVERMEKRGLVVRRPCPVDRRGINVVATAAGKKLLREVAPVLVDATEEHFGAHLSKKELGELETLLNRVLVANGYEPHFPAI